MKQDSEDKLAHVLEALENPSSFTQEELKSLFSDKECLRYARTILYAKESLARQQIPQPDIDKEWRTFERHHKKTSIIPIIIGLAIASCIALFFIFSFSKEVEGGLRVFEATQTVQIVKEETVNGMTTVYVPRGMQKRLELPDGTCVTLNAESQLTYETSQFGQNERKVILQGEALFDVAKDSLRPFIVQSGKLSTKALGTVFNVKDYSTEEMKITLLSGSLKITSQQKTDSVFIHPGEQAILTNQQELRTVKIPQTEDITSWAEGNFYFDNQTLVEILCELGRWYNVSVIFKSKDCMNTRLHFKAFRNESLASVVELLNYVSKNPVVLEDRTIIVGK